MNKNILSLVFIVHSSLIFAQLKVTDTEVKTTNNQTVAANQIINKTGPTLLVFWATWCTHCTDGLTDIQDEYYEDWQEEMGVKIVAVSVDDSRNTSRVAPYAEGKGWEFEVYLDVNGDFRRAMNVNNAPHVFILDKSGQVVWQNNAYFEGDAEIIYQELLKIK